MSGGPVPPPDAQVMDLGYRAYTGPRGGRAGAVRALAVQGLRRGMGLGRRARAKILPFGFLAFGLAGAGGLLVLRFGVGLIGGPFDLADELPGPAGLFGFVTATTQVLAAITAIELVAPDRSSGLLRLISARPLTHWDYAGARVAALAGVLAIVLVPPQVLLAMGTVVLAAEPGATAADQLPLLWQVPVVVAAAAGAWGGTALLVASLVERRAVGIGAVLAVLFVLSPAIGAAAQNASGGWQWVGLLAVNGHPGAVRDWVLGSDPTTVVAMAGLPPGASLAVSLMLGAAAVVVLAVRARSAA